MTRSTARSRSRAMTSSEQQQQFSTPPSGSRNKHQSQQQVSQQSQPFTGCRNNGNATQSGPSGRDVNGKQSTKAPECAGCHKPILERYLLKALEQVWHEDCLKCSCCNCRLGEIGSTLFTKADLILCKRDYLRMFGTTGFCSSCNKQIPAFEMVMRARGNVYHLECFKCEACDHRFCVGDRFYLHENKILCEYDYEEQMALSQLQQQQQQQRQFYQSLEHPSSSSSISSGASKSPVIGGTHECSIESHDCVQKQKQLQQQQQFPPSPLTTFTVGARHFP